VAKVEWLGAIGGVIQLTLHGSGLTNAACAQFEVFCNRCILPLAGSAQSLLHLYFGSINECQSVQETMVVTVV
jgi:hypothetical protein